MHEQQQKLQDIGISSICLDRDMEFEHNLLDQLDDGKYKAVFTTPEFIFCEDSRATSLWSRVEWIQRLRAVIVDEAHCVATWGRTFRKSYLRLGDLRANVHPQTAFVAISATLPTKILEDVKRILHFRTPHIINTGNDRSNIRLEVRYLKKTRLATLDFLTDFEKTIVYLEARKETMAAFNNMKTLVSADDLSKIASYHALLSSETKDNIMRRFKQGNTKLLFATEAAGLGCDIPDETGRVVG
jgi:superfamily II DNA helicase RecQ